MKKERFSLSFFLPKKPTMKYKRILSETKREALMGDKQFGIDNRVINDYAEEIKTICDEKVEIAIVIGGGNIFRGVQAELVEWIEHRVITWECLLL